MYGSSDQGFCLVVFIHRILWSPTSKENSLTCRLISYEAKEVVYHYNYIRGSYISLSIKFKLRRVILETCTFLFKK